MSAMVAYTQSLDPTHHSVNEPNPQKTQPNLAYGWTQPMSSASVIGISIKNLVKFRHLLYDICSQTDRQRDRQTSICRL